MKKKDVRNKVIKLRVNDEEYDFIMEKYAQTNCASLSDFIRKLLVYGYVLEYDGKELAEIRRLLANMTNNINQIARAVNARGSFYKAEAEEIRRRQDELNALYLQSLEKMERMKRTY